MPRRVIASTILILISMAPSAQDSETQLFQIAGVGPMELPTTDAGGLPAEDRKVRVDFAGFMIIKPKDNPNQAALVWSFGFRNKSLKNIESVMVEEVSPSPVAVVLVQDPAPALRGKDWIGSTEMLTASRDNHPWLYESGPAVFVFRFTIKERGKDPRVYYQPTSFSSAAKKEFRLMIDKINGS